MPQWFWCLVTTLMRWLESMTLIKIYLYELLNQFSAAGSSSCRPVHGFGTGSASSWWLGADLCHRLLAWCSRGCLKTARRRLIGTFLGVIIAAIQIYLTPYNLINYGLAIAVLGLVCSTAQLHSSAFRFGAIALTVVVTEPNHTEVWMTAATRFADVAVGIVVALLVLLVWPRISET